MFMSLIFLELSIRTRLYIAHKNAHLFHFLNPESQITAYIDDVRKAW